MSARELEDEIALFISAKKARSGETDPFGRRRGWGREGGMQCDVLFMNICAPRSISH